MKMNLYWKDIDGNIYNIGTLLKGNKYIFLLNDEEYKKAQQNGCAGIGNLGNGNQESEQLFQFFKERIPGKDSPRLKKILEIFNMETYDEFELLRRSKAKVITDRFFLEEEKFR